MAAAALTVDQGGPEVLLHGPEVAPGLAIADIQGLGRQTEGAAAADFPQEIGAASAHYAGTVGTGEPDFYLQLHDTICTWITYRCQGSRGDFEVGDGRSSGGETGDCT